MCSTGARNTPLADLLFPLPSAISGNIETKNDIDDLYYSPLVM